MFFILSQIGLDCSYSTTTKFYFQISRFSFLSAFGCADVLPPAGAWLKRDSENLMIRCNETGETWYLTCRDNSWIGEIGNCSSASEYGLADPRATGTSTITHFISSFIFFYFSTFSMFSVRVQISENGLTFCILPVIGCLYQENLN